MDRQPPSLAPPPAAVAAVDGLAGMVRDVLGWLESVDGAGLTDAARLALLTGLERLRAGAAAAQARVTVAFADSQAQAARDRSVRELTRAQEAGLRRSVGSQVALARRESPSKGDRLVGLARALVREMPQTLAVLTHGETTEWRATVVVRETSVLTREDRLALDARIGPLLPRLGDAGTERAARRLAQELDASAAVRRMERAVASRRVSTRPAPDGMAYLTVLGPLTQVVGAYAALQRHATAVVGGGATEPDGSGIVDEANGRGRGQVMADTALRWLSGLAVGEAQPVEVALVMSEGALLGRLGEVVDEPARVPGHGTLPASVAHALLRGDAGGQGRAWLRRLYTSTDGRDLVAMDSTRRTFSGGLRRLVLLRDDVCRTPWCDAPIRHVDHVARHASGGPTSAANAAGLCQRCNLVKEQPGWYAETVTSTDHGADPGRPRLLSRHTTRTTTPTGLTYESTAPPVLGWGWHRGATGRPPDPWEDDDLFVPDGARALTPAEAARSDPFADPVGMDAWLGWVSEHDLEVADAMTAAGEARSARMP